MYQSDVVNPESSNYILLQCSNSRVSVTAEEQFSKLKERRPTVKKLTAILALTLFGASLGTAQAASLSEARTAAKAMNASWNYAFNHGDVKALTALYTPDALLLPPIDKTLYSRPEIRDYMASLIKQGYTDHTISVVKVRVEGDTAYQVAVWSALSPQGKRVGGNLVTVLRRQPDGNWRQAVQTWN